MKKGRGRFCHYIKISVFHNSNRVKNKVISIKMKRKRRKYYITKDNKDYRDQVEYENKIK